MSFVLLREPPATGGETGLQEDRRFRDLLSPADWAKLPLDVRRRFSKKLERGARVYSGDVTLCRISRIGFALSQALRIIGAPLPIADTSGLPTVVAVTDAPATGAQNWTRIFSRRNGFPQIIHSTKSFSGPTGLEEYIGCGIRMALTLSVDEHALIFKCAEYAIQFGRWRLRIPRWLEPGETIVSHRDLGDGTFLFSLKLAHPWVGELIRQEALYREVAPCPAASS